MCKVQSVIKSVETSLNILAKAHRNHTEDCCPEFSRSDYNDRLEAMTALTGVFPVYGSPMAICNEVAQDLKEAIYANEKRMTSSIRTNILHILSYTSPDNWANNSIEKSVFDDLKDRIKVANENWETVIQNEVREPEEYAQFELIKKSSPKMSNLIASILKWAGRDPQNDAVVKKFNARQAKAMDGYDMVISVEPHRISGMSAFGQFTSCQDWLRKDKGHDYHNYTHRAWANLLDETCGIAYIRKTEDDEPSEQQTKVEDMQARSLVRAIELPNGQIVVYLHRIYAVSPFDQVMRETFNQWEKTLPENVHVIKMYDHSPSSLYRGTNKYGLEFDGFTRFTHKQEECIVTAGANCQCDACEGEGHRECHVCDGSGELYITLSGYDCEDNYYEEETCCSCRNCNGEGNVECHNCEGAGIFENDEESYEPYNDHCDWIDFNYKGVRFEVPNYIMNWDMTPDDFTRDQEEKYGKFTYRKGDSVVVRGDILSHHNAYHMYHNNKISDCATYDQKSMGGKVVVIDRVDLETQKYRVVGSSDWWTDEMFLGKEGEVSAEVIYDLDPTNIKVGDAVQLRDGLNVDGTYGDLTLLYGMVFDGDLNVTKVVHDSVGNVYYELENDYTYTAQMVEKASTVLSSDFTLPRGTKVRVREDLVYGRQYQRVLHASSLGINDDMVAMGGQIVEILSYDRISGTYRVSGSSWSWSNDMFSKIVNTVEVI